MMKTSVVLLALAAAALAAPTLHEETIDEPKIPARFLDAFTRERKSTLEQAPGTPVNLPSQVSEFGVTGRSFNLKKPIIIKKKVGSSYQVYRDSDEEKLDSPVPCRKQVRVSLCDEQSLAKTDMMKSATNEDPSIEMTEEDMKHSIMLAKQAVENFQMDLKNVEEPSKDAPWKHGEADAELHQDIESARLALEHIHNTFDNLESSKPHGSSMKSAEIAEDVTIPLAHTEEERLAQWKDAIDNIQRNVELVRNIEDSFKSTHDDMAHTNEAVTSTKDVHKNILPEQSKHDMRAPEQLKEENKQMTEQMEHSTLENSEHNKKEKSSEQNEMVADKVEKDMLESASMVSASKIQDLSHDDKERLSSKQDFTLKAKDAIDVDSMKLDHTIQHTDTMKMANHEELKSETEKSIEGKLEDSMMKKSTSAEKEDSLDQQRNTNKDIHDVHAQFKHDEQATSQSNKMKSAELEKEQHAELIKDEGKTLEQHHIMEKLRDATSFTKEQVPVVQFRAEEKNVGNENPLQSVATSSSDPMMLPHEMIENNLEMKEAEHMNNNHHQLHEQHHMRWAGDKDMKTETGLVKSAAETRQMIPTQMHPGHHHIHQHAHQHMSGHQMDHDHLRHHDQFMAHGKSANMDNAMQPSFYMNMRDSEQDGQRFRWRPSHMPEAARSAYGAPAPAAAPATGAIGLFPNANVGGCGIPLLLSCNPSVVSGSLAKAHPAPYSAPAYRNEDDFNFHHKRDVKKTNPLKNTVLVAKQ